MYVGSKWCVGCCSYYFLNLYRSCQWFLQCVRCQWQRWCCSLCHITAKSTKLSGTKLGTSHIHFLLLLLYRRTLHPTTLSLSPSWLLSPLSSLFSPLPLLSLRVCKSITQHVPITYLISFYSTLEATKVETNGTGQNYLPLNQLKMVNVFNVVVVVVVVFCCSTCCGCCCCCCCYYCWRWCCCWWWHFNVFLITSTTQKSYSACKPPSLGAPTLLENSQKFTNTSKCNRLQLLLSLQSFSFHMVALTPVRIGQHTQQIQYLFVCLLQPQTPHVLLCFPLYCTCWRVLKSGVECRA